MKKQHKALAVLGLGAAAFFLLGRKEGKAAGKSQQRQIDEDTGYEIVGSGTVPVGNDTWEWRVLNNFADIHSGRIRGTNPNGTVTEWYDCGESVNSAGEAEEQCLAAIQEMARQA